MSMRIVLVLSFVAAVSAQDADPGPRVVLHDGTVVVGEPEDAGGEVLVGERKIAKTDIADIHGGPEALQAQVLVHRYLEEPDRRAVTALRKRILALKTLSFDELHAVVRDRPIRPPARPGTSRFELTAGKETFDVLLFVPETCSPETPTPLWITVHGTGGRARNPFGAMEGHARQRGFLLAALSENESRHGKGWGYLEPERVAHLELVRHLQRRFNVDHDRIWINGWSRGGHASWDMAMRFPDVFAGAGPIIGSVRMRDLSLVHNLGPVAIDAVNGAQDQPELVAGARAAAEALKKMGATARYFEDPARGHAGFGDRVDPMVTWLTQRRRNAAPERIVFRTYEAISSRAWWIRVDKLSSKVYTPGRQIRIKGVSSMTQEQRREAYLDAVAGSIAEVRAEIEPDNRVSVKTRLVSKLRVYLPRDRLDFSKKITVTINGRRKLNRKVKPSKAVLLRSVRESGDRSLGWAYEVRASGS